MGFASLKGFAFCLGLAKRGVHPVDAGGCKLGSLGGVVSWDSI